MRFYIRPIALRAAYLGGAAMLFMAGLALSLSYDVELQIHTLNAHPDSSLYAPDYTRRSGAQLVMVYFGSASCAWSNRPSLPDAVETIKRELAERAEEQGMTFKAVGVALDWSPEQGIEHLETMGRFDEISAGYNWGNSLALRHIWSDAFAAPNTPQILVYRQDFVAPEDEASELHYAAVGQELLMTKFGFQAITDWAEAGAGL